MDENRLADSELIPHDDHQPDSWLQPREQTPLALAGQLANRIAGQNLFQRYLNQKSANTIKRQARDLELLAEYLIDAHIPLENGANFQFEPQAWQGISWGLVEGFVQWLLQEGYAINSVNARLSTVRTYAQLAVKAGAIERTEGVLIQSVKGFSRQEGLNVDEQREQRRIRTVTYAYKPGPSNAERPAGRQRSVVVTRRSTKKLQPIVLDEETASHLKRPDNDSPQAWRDALLLCLLLDHGLRASEVALLKVGKVVINEVGISSEGVQAAGEMTFYRPKVKGTDREWTTHKLTPSTLAVASYYIGSLYPPPLLPDGPLILATTRLLKNGQGGQLLGEGLNRVRISERVKCLGRKLGVSKLSAHDCRHTCATRMARLGYSVDELLAWFGWTSAQTAMRYVGGVAVKERYKG